jgi:ArsR family transcriptional regulator, arsenate/arsenite/antimonite-responsive transcriptional repressor
MTPSSNAARPILKLPAATAKPAAKTAKLPRARQTAIFKALADPHRFELLQQIAQAGCPLGCSQALSAMSISAATLSHHVKELESAGLIDIRREGKFAYLTLRPGVLQSIAAALTALDTTSCPGR